MYYQPKNHSLRKLTLLVSGFRNTSSMVINFFLCIDCMRGNLVYNFQAENSVTQKLVLFDAIELIWRQLFRFFHYYFQASHIAALLSMIENVSLTQIRQLVRHSISIRNSESSSNKSKMMRNQFGSCERSLMNIVTYAIV